MESDLFYVSVVNMECGKLYVTVVYGMGYILCVSSLRKVIYSM